MDCFNELFKIYINTVNNSMQYTTSSYSKFSLFWRYYFFYTYICSWIYKWIYNYSMSDVYTKVCLLFN